MTEYQKSLPVSGIAFPPQRVAQSFPAVLEENGWTQLHIAESEKERFVTYYFRGMNEGELAHEQTVIVPSPKVSTYDRKPEMSLPVMAPLLIDSILRSTHDFYIMNIANPDMVAHTGLIPASIKACEIVDSWIGKIAEAVLQKNGVLCITADHGNVEELITYPSGGFFYTTNQGTVNTDHSNNPVPFIVVKRDLEGKSISLPQGALYDVAPTMLQLMDIAVPAEMSGKNLLEGFNITNRASV